eukprot:355645-Chlamydomonas_euryale.AAC.43
MQRRARRKTARVYRCALVGFKRVRFAHARARRNVTSRLVTCLYVLGAWLRSWRGPRSSIFLPLSSPHLLPSLPPVYPSAHLLERPHPPHPPLTAPPPRAFPRAGTLPAPSAAAHARCRPALLRHRVTPHGRPAGAPT